MVKRSKRTWSRVKAVLGARSDVSLLDLLHDLYDLSEDNRDFMHARVAHDDSSLRPYVQAVESALYPNVYKDDRVRLSDARRAIGKYRKATSDTEGTLELMLRYVECGTAFTANYGDMEETFYSSLESMFNDILDVVGSLPSGAQEAPLTRLVKVVEQARKVGWGYHDYISDALYLAFPDLDNDAAEPSA
jgi:hypothetical protein